MEEEPKDVAGPDAEAKWESSHGASGREEGCGTDSGQLIIATLFLDAALLGGAGPLLTALPAALQLPRQQAAAPLHCPQHH